MCPYEDICTVVFKDQLSKNNPGHPNSVCVGDGLYSLMGRYCTGRYIGSWRDQDVNSKL